MGDDTQLRVLEGGQAQDGGNVVLQPPGSLQASDDIVLVELLDDAAQPGDDVQLIPGLVGTPGEPAPEPEPEPEPGYIFNGLTVAAGTRWRPRAAQQHDRRLRSGWPARPGRRDAAPRQRWGTAATVLDLRWHIPWQNTPQVDVQPRVAWGARADTGLREAFGIIWTRPPARDAERRVAWGNDPTRIEARWAVGYSHPPARDTETRVTWGTQPTAISREARAVWLDSVAKDSIAYRVPWGYSTAVRYAFGEFQPDPEPPPEPQPTPCYERPDGDAVALQLRGAYTPPRADEVPLNLSCITRVLYARRSYIMSHSVSVVRLPNREQMTADVLGIRIGIDEDSWAWTFSMTLARRASYHLLLPTASENQEIEVAIDGQLWTFTVEDTGEDRGGPGQLTRFTASGRSRTALLAAPYSPERSYTHDSAMSGAQLADRELELTGFTLDWQGPTWTVPAGAWSYSSLTRMGAITRIAEAAGCIVQSHPSDKIVQVLPRYPALPWNWSGETPDVQLDSSALVGLGMRRLPGPKYHGVYVSGETQGVLVEITRSGSSGSPYAELIVDPINTDNAPAIQRGGAVLAEAQDRTEQPLRLPFSQAVGVIAPTDLVEVQDPVFGTYRVRASAVTIDVGLQNDAVTVRQDVTVHRHHDDLE